MNDKLFGSSHLFLVLVLLCGCGGGRPSGTPLTPPSTPPSGSPPPSPNIAGHWQFTTTSLMGMPPATLAGSLAQSGKSVSGAVHVDGSNCVDWLTTIDLTGSVTGSSISLTSASVGGQITTLTGSITNAALTGTYNIKGGCADGDHGNVIGTKLPYLANQLSGTFTTSGQQTFDIAGNIAQNGDPSPDGSYGVSGTATFNVPCFNSGTITPGTLSQGSFVLGSRLALEIETGNGIVTFGGTVNQDRTEIIGNYAVSGGTCDDSGTAVLHVSSPWDY